MRLFAKPSSSCLRSQGPSCTHEQINFLFFISFSSYLNLVDIGSTVPSCKCSRLYYSFRVTNWNKFLKEAKIWRFAFVSVSFSLFCDRQSQKGRLVQDCPLSCPDLQNCHFPEMDFTSQVTHFVLNIVFDHVYQAFSYTRFVPTSAPHPSAFLLWKLLPIRCSRPVVHKMTVKAHIGLAGQFRACSLYIAPRCLPCYQRSTVPSRLFIGSLSKALFVMAKQQYWSLRLKGF